MTGHLDSERLEELGVGARPEAAEEMHLSQCEGCARELGWVRVQRELLRRRPQAPIDHLWAGVEDRLAPPRRRSHRPRWARRAAFGALVASAAALLVMALRPFKRPTFEPQAPVAQAPARQEPPALQPADGRGGDGPGGPDARTLAALDRAEADYRDAARVLEQEYSRIRPSLDAGLAARWDETLSRARVHLGEAQKNVVAMDVNARMRVLDGYAAYVRSLRTALISQEANP